MVSNRSKHSDLWPLTSTWHCPLHNFHLLDTFSFCDPTGGCKGDDRLPPASMVTTFTYKSLQYPSYPILWTSAFPTPTCPKGKSCFCLIGWFAIDIIKQFYTPAQCSSLTIEIKVPTNVKNNNNKKKSTVIKPIRSEYMTQPLKTFKSYTLYVSVSVQKIIMRLFNNWVRPVGKKITWNNCSTDTGLKQTAGH